MCLLDCGVWQEVWRLSPLGGDGAEGAGFIFNPLPLALLGEGGRFPKPHARTRTHTHYPAHTHLALLLLPLVTPAPPPACLSPSSPPILRTQQPQSLSFCTTQFSRSSRRASGGKHTPRRGRDAHTHRARQPASRRPPEPSPAAHHGFRGPLRGTPERAGRACEEGSRREEAGGRAAREGRTPGQGCGGSLGQGAASRPRCLSALSLGFPLRSRFLSSSWRSQRKWPRRGLGRRRQGGEAELLLAARGGGRDGALPARLSPSTFLRPGSGLSRPREGGGERAA